ncbi:MAG: carboxypeptidase regulatory-like domain-containing protein [Chthonomonadetes bacterium]|nr:carboxypeptidase regulatory-like domain-containing protein [Chthonomonadetes bacterium]
MRQATGNSFRMIAALAAMAALALAALTTLGGCGGGKVTGGGLPTGLLVQGVVQDENGRAVSGIRVKLLPGDASALTQADGRFAIPVSGSTPARFTVELAGRETQFLRYFTYGMQTFEIGCDLGPNLPAAQDNVIDIGNIKLYSQDAIPPPPGEVCSQ